MDREKKSFPTTLLIAVVLFGVLVLYPLSQGPVAWLEWNHPNMPWDGTELWVAELDDSGALRDARRVAGGVAESIFQPEWGAGGTLYFASDRTGFWNLYAMENGRTEALCPMDAEFGTAAWQFDMRSYALAGDGIVAICTRDAADVRTLAPEVPEKLARVIARALRRDREERYPTAQDMLGDLEAALRESRELAAKTRTMAGVWLDAPKRARPERYRTLVLAVVAALGGFSLAAYFIARSGSRPEALTDVDTAPANMVSSLPSLDAPALPSAPALLAPPPLASATAASKPPIKPSPGKPNDSAKPVAKKPPPVASAGVAGGLGLSTREP